MKGQELPFNSILCDLANYSDFLETTNNPIPIPESTTGIIQENV